MQNWTVLISRQFEVLADGDPEIKCLLGNPASEIALANAEKHLGLKFPAEFRSLYGTHNGFGSTYPRESEEFKDWLGLPLDRIGRLSDLAGEWITPEHNHVADNFLVIVNFATGDFAGYRLNDDGQVIGTGLLIFSHEHVDLKPTQNSDEFIFEQWPSLEAFLEDHAWDW